MSTPPDGSAAALNSDQVQAAMMRSFFGPPRAGNMGPMLIAVTTISIVLTTVFVGMRLTRSVQSRKFKPEDCLVFFSYFVLLSFNIFVLVSVHFGEGRHISSLRYEDLKWATELPLDAAPLSSAAIMCAKISAAFTLMHLDIHIVYRMLVYVAMFIAFAGNIQAIVITGGTCRPSMDNPDGAQNGTNCIPLNDVISSTYVQAGTNVASDVFLVLVPLYFIRQAKLSQRDRTAMGILIMFMFASMVISALKASALPKFFREAQSGDNTWASYPLEAYALSEATLCLVAACLPAVRQLLGNYFPTFLGLGGRREPNYSDGASGAARKSLEAAGEHGIAIATTTVQHVDDKEAAVAEAAERDEENDVELERFYGIGVKEMFHARTETMIESDERPLVDSEGQAPTVFYQH